MPPKSLRERPKTLLRYRLSLVRESRVRYDAEHLPGAEAVVSFLSRQFGDRDREVMGAVYMDVRNVELGYTVAYIGTLSRAAVEPRGVLVPALLCNASGLILFHTHPSGDPSPSAEDLAFTRRVREAGELLGVALLDHLILGRPPRFVSLRRQGQLHTC